MRISRSTALFVLTFAISLASASQAIAATEFRFKSTKYPADLADKSLSVQKFSIGSSVIIECAKAGSHGLAESEKQTSVIDTIKFEECKATYFGLAIKAATVSEGEFDLFPGGTVSILRSMTLKALFGKAEMACEVKIPAQGPLKGVGYSPQNMSVEELKMTAAVLGITQENSCGITGTALYEGRAGLFGEEQCWTTHEMTHRFKDPGCLEESATKEGLYEMYPPVEFLEVH